MLFQNVKSIFIFNKKKTKLLESTERNECNSEQNKTLEKEAKRQIKCSSSQQLGKKNRSEHWEKIVNGGVTGFIQWPWPWNRGNGDRTAQVQPLRCRRRASRTWPFWPLWPPVFWPRSASECQSRPRNIPPVSCHLRIIKTVNIIKNLINQSFVRSFLILITLFTEFLSFAPDVN